MKGVLGHLLGVGILDHHGFCSPNLCLLFEVERLCPQVVHKLGTLPFVMERVQATGHSVYVIYNLCDTSFLVSISI